MQFILTGKDGKDDMASERRIGARNAHLEQIKLLKEDGKVKYAVALLNEENKMIGSVIVYEVHDRAELDEILEKEPYLLSNVWQEVDIQTAQVPPIFE